MNEIFDRLTNKWGPRTFKFELSRDEERYLDDPEFLQKFRRRGYSVSVEYVQADHSVLMACKCCPEHNLMNRRVTTQGPVAEAVVTSSPGVMFGIERTTDNPRLAGMRVAGAVDCPWNYEAVAVPPPALDGAVCIRRSDAEGLLRWVQRNYPIRRNE